MQLDMSLSSPPKMASIIIPVRDDTLGLETTLTSLQSLETEITHEILVANDGGGAEISNIASKFDVKETHLPLNLGSYAARNSGIRASHGDILVFLDADQIISKNWLDLGVKALNEYDYVGGGVSIVINDDSDIWQLRDKIKAFPVKNCLEMRHFAPTANLFINRRVIDTVGMFNDKLRSSGDVDFGERVFKAGFKQFYCPAAITYHPARNKQQQLKKMRRLGYGIADKKIRVDKWHPIFFLIYVISLFVKLPIEIIFKTFFCLTRPNPILNKRKALQIMIIDKYCKFRLLTAALTRAFVLINSNETS